MTEINDLSIEDSPIDNINDYQSEEEELAGESQSISYNTNTEEPGKLLVEKIEEELKKKPINIDKLEDYSEQLDSDIHEAIIGKWVISFITAGLLALFIYGIVANIVGLWVTIKLFVLLGIILTISAFIYHYRLNRLKQKLKNRLKRGYRQLQYPQLQQETSI